MCLGDDEGVEAIGKGFMLIETYVDNKVKRIRIHEILHMAELYTILLSVSKSVARGLNVHINTMGVQSEDSKRRGGGIGHRRGHFVSIGPQSC